MAEEEEEVEGEGGEPKPPAIEEPPRPTEIHAKLTENGAYVASKLDALFSTTAKIQVDMAEMETRLRTEFDEKILVHHDLAMKRIVALEDLCAIYGLRLDEQKRTQNQRAMQLDDLQNQVGILFFRFH